MRGEFEAMETNRVESSAARLTTLALLFHAGTVGNLTDGQLTRTLCCREIKTAEHAFTVLVERAMDRWCWAFAGRILQDPHDAADAFQATFLVLIRRATALRVDDLRWAAGFME